MTNNPNRERFQFCPFCGQKGVGASCVKSHSCGACGGQFYMNAAGAVAAIIKDAEERVLVTVRNKEPGSGMWDLPGGFIDPGESAETALRREVFEELGFVPEPLTYKCSFPNIYQYKGVLYNTIDLFFSVEVEFQPELILNSEIQAVHWLTSDELDADRFCFSSVRMLLQRGL